VSLADKLAPIFKAEKLAMAQTKPLASDKLRHEWNAFMPERHQRLASVIHKRRRLARWRWCWRWCGRIGTRGWCGRISGTNGQQRRN
jgi:hypothetical protein